MPRTRAALVLTLVLAALCACGTRRPFDARREPSPVPLEGQVVEVPVGVSAGVVLVPTMVDGRGPLWFVLDTGSTTVVVSEKAAELTGMRIETRRGSIVTEAGRSEGDVRQAMLREIRIGNASYRFPTALVMDLDGISRGIGRPVDGILGVPLMRAHLWEIDADGATLRIFDGDVAASGAGTIPLTMDDGLPTIPIDVAGTRMAAIVDTGQRMAVSVGPDDVGPVRPLLREIGESVGQVLDGEVRRPVARLDGDVVVAPDIVLRAPAILLGRATRVGMQSFAGRVLTFDMKNARMSAAKR